MMVWACDANGRRENTKKMLQKWRGKRPRGRPRTRWIDQIRKDIEMRRENWEEIQELGE